MTAPQLSLLAAASTPGRLPVPDVVRAGEVMATLNDWRAVLLVALVLATLMLFALLWVVAMSFRVVTKQIAANVKAAEAMNALTNSTLSLSATLSRVESEVGQISKRIG